MAARLIVFSASVFARLAMSSDSTRRLRRATSPRQTATSSRPVLSSERDGREREQDHLERERGALVGAAGAGARDEPRRAPVADRDHRDAVHTPLRLFASSRQLGPARLLAQLRDRLPELLPERVAHAA